MIFKQKLLRILFFSVTFMLSNSAASQTPQSINQFCKILERDILSYYQIEMDNNVKYTNAKLPMSERNQALEIARSIKDMRIQSEGSWQRIGCIELIPKK